jgi:glutamyl-Q tRNA(Asp) synthetase
MRVRFAPSPTGYLHLGHAASAWFAWEYANQNPENFILRIEDIDSTRCRPEFEQAIYEDLRWLGMDWIQPVRRQSDHFADYKKALQHLDDMGLTYPCFCTRKEIAEEIARSPSAPHGPEGPLYPGTCRALSATAVEDKIAQGLPYAIRLNVAKAVKITGPLRWHDRQAGWQDARPESLGDAVLARKDTPASYHLCVTHDDALQDITLVTRGLDLFHATHLHRLLQALFKLPTPDYHHHHLLTDENGSKLSKRNNSLSLHDYRKINLAPYDLRRMIAAGETISSVESHDTVNT